MKVVAAWSGGKDSAYAEYLATQRGLEVVNILTMMMSKEKSNFHMIPAEHSGCTVRRHRHPHSEAASHPKNIRR